MHSAPFFAALWCTGAGQGLPKCEHNVSNLLFSRVFCYLLLLLAIADLTKQRVSVYYLQYSRHNVAG